MRFKRLLPAALAAAAALTVLSGAVASTNPSALSSTKSINAYLRSIGVNPGSVVRQHGVRNYAGPNCPGKGWTCTRSTRVVQMAADGGQNRVDCTATPTTGPTQECIVVQTTGANNSARCVERSNTTPQTQDCNIMQTGVNNDALIDQEIDQNAGSTQAAVQTAELTQTGSGYNHSTLRQAANQATHDGSPQSQDAGQAAVVTQTTSGAADNKSSVDQSQDQAAFGGIPQDQNAGTTTGFLKPPDCAPSGTVSAPDQCANILQTSDAGKNDSKLKQSVKEKANTDASGFQQQGTPGVGGIDANVHQVTATGSSLNNSDQRKRQDLKSAGGSQNQYDPMFCCGISQLGGSGNKEDINQDVSQGATGGFSFQESDVTGQSHTPEGTCAIHQNDRDNTDSANNSFSVNPCPFVILETSCTFDVEGGGCTAFPPITCIDCDLSPVGLFAFDGLFARKG